MSLIQIHEPLFQSCEAFSINITGLNATYDYLKHLGVFYPKIEGRITFVGGNEQIPSHATSIIPIPIFISLMAIGWFFIKFC